MENSAHRTGVSSEYCMEKKSQNVVCNGTVEVCACTRMIHIKHRQRFDYIVMGTIVIFSTIFCRHPQSHPWFTCSVSSNLRVRSGVPPHIAVMNCAVPYHKLCVCVCVREFLHYIPFRITPSHTHTHPNVIWDNRYVLISCREI